MTTTAPTTTVTSGCVKWFNTKAGYGFITLLDEATQQEMDVFVHHSEIQVSQSQYKYLVQGEYVECRLVPIEKEGHAIHATQVSGINGGKLMCETRNEARASRTPSYHERAPQTQQQQQAQPQAQQQQQHMPARVQQQRRPQQYRQTQAKAQPQLDPSDQDEWMIVRRRTQTDASSHTGSRQPYQQKRTTSSSSSVPTPQAKQHRPPRQQPQQPKIEL